MTLPAEWGHAAFSRGNTTDAQKATIAEVQTELGVWPPDGMPGPQTARAALEHPEGERLAARITEALTGACAHTGAAPVESTLSGAVVAWLCPACDAQLPVSWQKGKP